MIIREYEAKAIAITRAHDEADHEGSDGCCSCLYWAAQWRAAATAYATLTV